MYKVIIGKKCFKRLVFFLIIGIRKWCLKDLREGVGLVSFSGKNLLIYLLWYFDY